MTTCAQSQRPSATPRTSTSATRTSRRRRRLFSVSNSSYSRIPMWIVRELLRFVGRIAIALLIAIVIAEVRALISGGDTFWTFRVVLMLLGCLYLLLAAGPGASLGGRRMNDTSWWITSSMGWAKLQHVPGPKMTATAVFIGSGLVLLVLGVAL